MNDHEQVSCGEDHEMEYILRKFEKRGTGDNISALSKLCKEFKDASDDDGREAFYAFLEKNEVFKNLE